MNVLDFFKKDKPVKEIIYPGAQVGGKLLFKNDFSEESESEQEEEEEEEEDYAEEFIKKDIEDCKNAHMTVSFDRRQKVLFLIRFFIVEQGRIDDKTGIGYRYHRAGGR